MAYRFADRYEGITGSAIRQIFSLLADPEIISFAGGNPSPETFPSALLAEMSQSLLETEGDSILQYGGTAGIDDLFSVLQSLLEREGLQAKKEELIVLTGSSQGIELMTKAMIDPGDTVLVEAPSFLGALQTFKLYQANLVEVEMDEFGLDMADLERKMAKYHPKFLYTIPTFQNPSGRTLPAERREQMVRLAEKYDTLILEDDPYASLRYRGEVQPSIKSFDKNGVVVKLISFSKTISPGLRVGAAYGDAAIIHKFNLGKQGMDVHTSNLSQALVAAYVKSGAYFKGIERNCNLYRDKLDAMYQAALDFFPEGTQVVRPDGGMFLWASLPEALDATALFSKAVEKKVAYVPGTHFYADGGHHNTLRLNFTMVDVEHIMAGMKRLGDLFQNTL